MLFNINIRANSHIAGTVKVEKGNLSKLRVEMARFVGELLRDHAEDIWGDHEWQIDVANIDGTVLYILNISARETAATSGTVSRKSEGIVDASVPCSCFSGP